MLAGAPRKDSAKVGSGSGQAGKVKGISDDRKQRKGGSWG